jgi:hypothetical protein
MKSLFGIIFLLLHALAVPPAVSQAATITLGDEPVIIIVDAVPPAVSQAATITLGDEPVIIIVD